MLMKGIILYAIIWALAISVCAQGKAKVSVVPANVDAFTSPVTIILDARGTGLEGQSDVYVWSWAEGADPAEMKICGSNWGAILPSAKLDRVEGETDVYKIELPLTTMVNGKEETYNNFSDLFFIVPGKLKRIGFLLRNMDGSLQTEGDFATELILASLVFEDSEYRSFPSSVSVKDVVTVYLNQNFSKDLKVRIMEDVMLKISFMDAGDVVIGEMPDYVSAKMESSGVWSFTFLPDRLMVLQEDKTISDVVKMKLIYRGTLNKPDGSKEDVEREFEQTFKLYE